MKYLSWDECTKREQEMRGVKVDKVWSQDAQGYLKVEEKKSSPKARIVTDLSRVSLLSLSLSLSGALCLSLSGSLPLTLWTQHA